MTPDQPDQPDQPDRPEGWSAAPRPLSPTSLLVAVACLALMATFIIALAAAQPVHDVFVVVVGDPQLPAGQRTPLQVLGFERDRLVALQVTVNDAPIDDTGFGVAVADDAGLRVRGTFLARDGVSRPVHVDVPRAPRPPAVVEVTPWTQALAMPVAGAAVFPVDGRVASRARGRVVLVDDAGVQVVDVDTAADQRLPDQRLLAVDRHNVAIVRVDVVRVDRVGDDVEHAGDTSLGPAVVEVTLRARAASTVVVSVVVGDRLVALSPLAAGAGTTTYRVPLPALPAAGELVVAHVAESLLPSAPRAQLATRVGGWHDDDLLRVEPRAAAALADPVVREALGRALHVDHVGPTIVSPTASAQAAQHAQARKHEAAEARRRYRAMALLHVAVVVYAAWQARARLALAIAAAVLVGSIDLGLDAMIDVTAATSTGAAGMSSSSSSSPTSGSP